MLINETDVRQITKEEALELPKGSLILVRSNYKYETYDDHPALILGGTIKKERGIRPNLLTFPPRLVQDIRGLLNIFDPIDGVIILVAKQEIALAFLEMQNMHLSEGELIEVDIVNKLLNI